MQFGLAKSARFELSMYGEEAASALAHFWCHKVDYYYTVWQAAGEGPYVFTVQDHEGYSRRGVGCHFGRAAVGQAAEAQGHEGRRCAWGKSSNLVKF